MGEVITIVRFSPVREDEVGLKAAPRTPKSKSATPVIRGEIVDK